MLSLSILIEEPTSQGGIVFNDPTDAAGGGGGLQTAVIVQFSITQSSSSRTSRRRRVACSRCLWGGLPLPRARTNLHSSRGRPTFGRVAPSHPTFPRAAFGPSCCTCVWCGGFGTVLVGSSATARATFLSPVHCHGGVTRNYTRLKSQRLGILLSNHLCARAAGPSPSCGASLQL